MELAQYIVTIVSMLVMASIFMFLLMHVYSHALNLNQQAWNHALHAQDDSWHRMNEERAVYRDQISAYLQWNDYLVRECTLDKVERKSVIDEMAKLRSEVGRVVVHATREVTNARVPPPLLPPITMPPSTSAAAKPPIPSVIMGVLAGVKQQSLEDTRRATPAELAILREKT